MAKKLKAENVSKESNGGAIAGHNAKARQAVIADSLERLYKLDAEIDELIEEYIKELRDEKSDIFERLREDFGMPSKLVRARYASYKIERAAEVANDGVTLDAIRELYQVLPVGGQVDLVEAMAVAKKKEAAEDTRTPAQIAHDEGRKAAAEGKKLDACPYKPNQKRLKAEWESGYESEIFDAKSMGSQEARLN